MQAVSKKLEAFVKEAKKTIEHEKNRMSKKYQEF